jgi:dephospho-CoA kinase
LQLQRLKKRDNISEEDALKRISAQMPMSEKVEKADIVLDNSSDLKQLEIQVKNMVKKIKPSTFTWLLEYLGLPAALVLSVAFIKYLTPVVLGWF